MATKPIYKWWESDDKTKRTEEMLEKHTKPHSKTIENPSVKEIAYCDTVKRQLLSPSKLTAPPNSPTALESQVQSSLESTETTTDKKNKKYQFETITMETLAKYNYINSPKKQPKNIGNCSDRSIIDQEWNKQLAKLHSGKKKANTHKTDNDGLADITKSPQKSSQSPPNYTTQNYKKVKPNEIDEKLYSNSIGQPLTTSQPYLTRPDLAEMPEYDSVDVKETSTEIDGSISDDLECQSGKQKQQNNTITKKEIVDVKVQDKHQSKVTKKDENMSVLRGEELLNYLSNKHISLCENVEFLEFKLFEFSDDLYKLKKAVGVKTKEESEKVNGEMPDLEQQIKLASPWHSRSHYKHALTLSANKDLLTNKYSTKSLLLKHESLTIKTRPGQAFLQQNCRIPYNDSSNNTKDEKDFIEDEIQEILKSATAKYIDKTNCLKELEYCCSRVND